MKNILFLLFFLFLSTVISSSTFKKIKVFIDDNKTIKLMAKKGLAVDEVIYNRSERTIEMFINEYELSLIKDLGLKYEILIDDWIEYYKKRNQLSPLEKKTLLSKSINRFGVSHFNFGSMGGFYTLSEIYSVLDSMHTLYTYLITEKDSIGNTVENRPIYFTKISDNPSIDEDEPEVLYTSLIHAREPQGMMTLIYFMYYLLENYNTDSAVKYLVDNRELYFIPVINPDGYYFNEQENPDGGGFWRKNRRMVNDSTYGIDLNRNFGSYEFWNSINGGSSDEPATDIYRGEAPFSEPETQAIKDFLLTRDINTCLNYHTYSNLLLYPYGALPVETPDSAVFREFAQDMTIINNYNYGLDRELLYSTRGGSDDFMYSGDTPQRKKILSMSPEVGDYFDGNNGNGFWPIQSNILPIAQENLHSNLYIAWVAGSYIKLNSFSTFPAYFNPGDSITLSLDLKNKGVLASNDVKISLESITDNAFVSADIIEVDQIPEHTSINFQFPKKIDVSVAAGTNENIQLQLNIFAGNLLISKDTINLKIGIPVVLFSDSCNTQSDLWEFSGTSYWDITDKTFHSGSSCYTDSKDGNYSQSSMTIMTTKDLIDLTGKSNVKLSFWTKYDISKITDLGSVEVSSDSGLTWLPLSGKYTRIKSDQGLLFGSDVYDGSQYDWVKEEMDLSLYTNQKIKLRFSLIADGQFNRDGWYIDDINIISYSTIPAALADQNSIISFQLGQNYPNPFNPVTSVKYSIPVNSSLQHHNKKDASRSMGRGVLVSLKVYDILGKEIAVLVNKEQIPGNYEVTFDGSRFSSGTYFYKLQAGDFIEVKKMLLLK